MYSLMCIECILITFLMTIIQEVRIIEKKSSFNELLEFDSTLSSQNRSEFLQLVFSKSVVLAAVRIDAQCTTEDNSKGPSIAGKS